MTKPTLRLSVLSTSLLAVTAVFVYHRSHEAFQRPIAADISRFIQHPLDPLPPPILVKKDLYYPIQTGGSEVFDLYAPSNYMEASYPILIWIHGGGWRIGDKSDWLSINFAQHAAELGFMVLNVNYRLDRPNRPAPYPAATDDIESFTRYLASHLDLVHATNLTRVSLGGHSAGGQLALYEATNESSPFRYACVVDVAGVTDLSDPALPATLRTFVDAFAPSVIQRQQASPIRRVASWRADQILFVHSVDDAVVPLSQSSTMGKALSALAAPPRVRYWLLSHGGHDVASVITNRAIDDFLPKNCR